MAKCLADIYIHKDLKSPIGNSKPSYATHLRGKHYNGGKNIHQLRNRWLCPSRPNMLYWSVCLYWDHLPFWLCCVAGNVLTMPSLRHVNLFAVAVSKAKTNTTITITIIRFWANTELLMYWEEKNETRQKWNLNPRSILIRFACLELLSSDVHSAGKRLAVGQVEGSNSNAGKMYQTWSTSTQRYTTTAIHERRLYQHRAVYVRPPGRFLTIF